MTTKDRCNSINIFLNECTYYKHCKKERHDICEHPHCQYSISVLCKESYFKCGRRK